MGRRGLLLPWSRGGAGSAEGVGGGEGGGRGGGGGAGGAVGEVPGCAALWRVRVVVRGARGAGKSALTERLCGGGFSDSSPSPPGTAARAVPWRSLIGGVEDVVLELWEVTDPDCASPGPLPPEDLETFLEGARSAASPRRGAKPLGRTLPLTSASSDQIYRGCHCCLICYHPGDPATLDWAREELRRVPGGVPVALIAGFRDLGPVLGSGAGGWAPLEESRALCDEISSGRPVRVRCLEVSAKDCFGLEALYNFLHIPFLLYKRSEMKRALELNGAALGEASDAVESAGRAVYDVYKEQQGSLRGAAEEESPKEADQALAVPQEPSKPGQGQGPPPMPRPQQSFSPKEIAPSAPTSSVQKLVSGLGSMLGGGRRQQRETANKARHRDERRRQAEQVALDSNIGDGVPDGFFDSDDEAPEFPAHNSGADAPPSTCSPDRPSVLWVDEPDDLLVEKPEETLTPLDSPARDANGPLPVDSEAEFFADCSENPGTELSCSSPDSSGPEGLNEPSGPSATPKQGGAPSTAAGPPLGGPKDFPTIECPPPDAGADTYTARVGAHSDSDPAYGGASVPEISSEGMLADASEGLSDANLDATLERKSSGGDDMLESILAQAQAGLASQLSEAEAQAQAKKHRKHRKHKHKDRKHPKHRKDHGGGGETPVAPDISAGGPP